MAWIAPQLGGTDTHSARVAVRQWGRAVGKEAAAGSGGGGGGAAGCPHGCIMCPLLHIHPRRSQSWGWESVRAGRCAYRQVSGCFPLCGTACCYLIADKQLKKKQWFFFLEGGGFRMSAAHKALTSLQAGVTCEKIGLMFSPLSQTLWTN